VFHEEELMQPFDKDYLARREKQIKDMYEMRAATWACLVTGLILTPISVLLMAYGSRTLGLILFVVSLMFEAGSIFMFFSYFGQKAADRAIQQERDQLWALYGDKPKRGQDSVTRLADDGELVVETEEQIAHRDGH
jgi:hypothetical protein